MRILENAEGRETRVALTDRDVQLISRALFKDSTNNDENSSLNDEFSELESGHLGLDPL